MRVVIPVETPVYFRRCARERFVLRHVCRSGFVKHVPLTLSVSDLRAHSLAEEQRVERDTVPVLVLLTGKRAAVYCMKNWSCPKRVTLSPREFSHGQCPNFSSEIDEDHYLLRSYTHLTTYALRQGQYFAQDSTCIESSGNKSFVNSAKLLMCRTY